MFIATLLVVAKNRGKPASHCRENEVPWPGFSPTQVCLPTAHVQCWQAQAHTRMAVGSSAQGCEVAQRQIRILSK